MVTAQARHGCIVEASVIYYIYVFILFYYCIAVVYEKFMRLMDFK